MAKHALLSPSSSHRWLVCTPSAYLESLEPEQGSSVYAQEGTEAHELAEIKLSYALGKINEQEYSVRFENFRMTSRFYSAEFNEYVNTYITEVMNMVRIDYADIKTKVYLEEYVNYDHLAEGGGGTSDVVIVGPDFIHVIDLKFGKGVAVSAKGNPQLRLYALGAARKFIVECPCRVVKMTICQPRLYDTSHDTLTIEELNDWAIEVVRPQAKLAIAGQGTITPGDHCRFCKRAGKCQELSNKQLEIAKAEFEEVVEKDMLEPQNMTPDMLARILEIAPKFSAWFGQVTGYAMSAMINDGLKIPGFKLVEGRSIRKVIDPEGLAEVLRESGFSDDKIYQPKELQGLTSLEKTVGKKLFDSLCGRFIVKPRGKVTIAAESDKRLALEASTLRLDGSEFTMVDEFDE
jgi:hypothetical protein